MLAVSLTDVASIATIFESVVVATGIAFAVVQLRELRRARNLETIKLVFEGFHDRGAYAERDAILERGPVVPEEASSEERLLYMWTADYFQRLGFLSDQGFVSRDYINRMYSGTIISIWDCLEPFVGYMRGQAGLSNYSCDFQSLVESAREYRSRAYPGEALRFVQMLPGKQGVPDSSTGEE